MTTGLITGAAYMLYLYRRVIFGTLTKPDLKGMADLSVREYAILAPIAAAVLWMGVAPNVFIDPVRAPVGRVLARLAAARPPVTAIVRAAPAPAKVAAR